MHCSLHINTIAGLSTPPFERVQKHCKAGCQQNKTPHNLLMGNNTLNLLCVVFPVAYDTLPCKLASYLEVCMNVHSWWGWGAQASYRLLWRCWTVIQGRGWFYLQAVVERPATDVLAPGCILPSVHVYYSGG